MTDHWKPTTKPRKCAMRCDPHTPVRVLATDLPGEYPVAYVHPVDGDTITVKETGRLYAGGSPSVLDLVPFRPKIEAWAVVKNGRVLATASDRESAKAYCLRRDVRDAELVLLNPAKWFD